AATPSGAADARGRNVARRDRDVEVARQAGAPGDDAAFDLSAALERELDRLVEASGEDAMRRRVAARPHAEVREAAVRARELEGTGRIRARHPPGRPGVRHLGAGDPDAGLGVDDATAQDLARVDLDLGAVVAALDEVEGVPVLRAIRRLHPDVHLLRRDAREAEAAVVRRAPFGESNALTAHDDRDRRAAQRLALAAHGARDGRPVAELDDDLRAARAADDRRGREPRVAHVQAVRAAGCD